jgi:hypothetical protein
MFPENMLSLENIINVALFQCPQGLFYYSLIWLILSLWYNLSCPRISSARHTSVLMFGIVLALLAADTALLAD